MSGGVSGSVTRATFEANNISLSQNVTLKRIYMRRRDGTDVFTAGAEAQMNEFGRRCIPADCQAPTFLEMNDLMRENWGCHFSIVHENNNPCMEQIYECMKKALGGNITEIHVMHGCSGFACLKICVENMNGFVCTHFVWGKGWYASQLLRIAANYSKAPGVILDMDVVTGKYCVGEQDVMPSAKDMNSCINNTTPWNMICLGNTNQGRVKRVALLEFDPSRLTIKRAEFILSNKIWDGVNHMHSHFTNDYIFEKTRDWLSNANWQLQKANDALAAAARAAASDAAKAAAAAAAKASQVAAAAKAALDAQVAAAAKVAAAPKAAAPAPVVPPVIGFGAAILAQGPPPVGVFPWPHVAGGGAKALVPAAAPSPAPRPVAAASKQHAAVAKATATPAPKPKAHKGAPQGAAAGGAAKKGRPRKTLVDPVDLVPCPDGGFFNTGDLVFVKKTASSVLYNLKQDLTKNAGVLRMVGKYDGKWVALVAFDDPAQSDVVQSLFRNRLASKTAIKAYTDTDSHLTRRILDDEMNIMPQFLVLRSATTGGASGSGAPAAAATAAPSGAGQSAAPAAATGASRTPAAALVVAADTEGEESDDGKAPAAPVPPVQPAAAVAPSSSGKSMADVVPIVPAQGEKCCNGGCFRSAFGNDELEACCGTCTQTNGMRHGPHCENNYWEQQVLAWRPVVVPTSAGNAAGPTSTGAPIMFSSESEKGSGSDDESGSGSEGSDDESGSGSESDRGNETDDDDWRKDNHNIDPEDPRQTHHQGFLYDKSLRAKKAAKKAAKQAKNAAKAATGGQGGSARGAGGSAGGKRMRGSDLSDAEYAAQTASGRWKRKADSDDDDEGGGASKKP